MHNPTPPFLINPIDQQLIELALREDLDYPFSDLTTNSLIFTKKIQEAKIISKHSEPIHLSGLALLPEIMKHFSPLCELHTQYHDGDVVNSHEVILTLSGSPKILLMLERTLLNFLQRLCGIATLTAQFVSQVKHTPMKILDTRKTTPGMRHLEKYAVFCGGGVNHRMGLYDAMMIKDTHIDLVGGLSNVLRQLPPITEDSPFAVVEVRDEAELKLLLSEGLNKVNRVLLDNMTLDQLRECVALCRDKLPTEASGNITLNNIQAVAETGVNFASIGKITHSAAIVDLSMKCD